MQLTKQRLTALDSRVDGAHASLLVHGSSLQAAQARLQTLNAAVSDLHRRTALAEGVDELTKEVVAAKAMLEGAPYAFSHTFLR